MERSLGIAHFLEHADAVAWVVLAILIAMSLASWYCIAAKGMQWLRAQRASQAFLASFNAASRVPGRAPTSGARDPYGKLAEEAFEAAERHRSGVAGNAADAASREEYVARALKRSIVHQSARLEAGQTLLATVASTAPFVGLFGTVWGIHHALLAIGDAGAAGLQEVAGPVGEALIMTGLGLAVAIPASMAYNAFARARRNLRIGLDAFAHDLLALLADGASPPRGQHDRANDDVRAPHAMSARAPLEASGAN